MASCVVITTNKGGERLKSLETVILSIEKNRTDFIKELILSIDILPQFDTELSVFDKYKTRGWTIVSGKFRSMVRNQMNGINLSKNDIIFYCEDDVEITKIPSLDTITKLDENFNFGAIFYNTHINDKFDNKVIEYINNRDNYITINGSCFLKKKPYISDSYLFCFPVAIMKKSLVTNIHKYMMDSKINLQIEKGFTHAFKEINSKYSLFTYVNNTIIDNLTFKNDVPQRDSPMHNYANMLFWNNDETKRLPRTGGVIKFNE